jgi:D-sedoheptulose 7-phosphate isomerase
MTGREHMAALGRAVASLERRMDEVEAWGEVLAGRLCGGARLLAAGNGGSAAHAQHLTAELVGRYRDERRPLSAIALHADTSSLTAIVNDYGADQCFARQVTAHGRTGDVLMAISTSGRSPNLVTAVEAARAAGMRAWALTGPGPNPLASAAHEALAMDAETTATIQEVHQVVVHLICAAVDRVVARDAPVARLAVAR